MGRGSRGQQLRKLVGILTLLGELGGWTVEELAEKVGCGCRTVYRYMEELRGAGFSIEAVGLGGSTGAHYRWRVENRGNRLVGILKRGA